MALLLGHLEGCGGVGQHPIHNEDQDDVTPSDYEREIDRLDAAARSER